MNFVHEIERVPKAVQYASGWLAMACMPGVMGRYPLDCRCKVSSESSCGTWLSANFPLI